MAYRASESRYRGGGEVKYLVYQSPQPLRNGRSEERTRVQRLYFPPGARDIELDRPGTVEKRTGRRVHGVAVHYRHRLSGARAQRGETRYNLPERWTDRTKVVELPEGSRSLRLTNNPPEGPRQAVE